MTRWERWLLALFSIGLVLGLFGVIRLFYSQNTILVPTTGGTYIEGSVGELRPLIPWFTVENDVNRDIVSLVFGSLLRYDPHTRKIEEDLATMEVSKDQKVYTLKLKEGVEWQDSTAENPQPVTADDILFTFQTIQDPAFPNQLLQQNFRGVKIEKVDARTVKFTLDEAYSFFPSNLTLGLIPQHLFEGIPIDKLDQASDFAYHPVGAGPYKVKSVITTDFSSEVTLERFDRLNGPVTRLDRVVFRIFPDYSSLLTDVRNLQGIRLVPRNPEGDPILPRRFSARTYYLPQYVALFLNLDRPQLKDEKLRVGLQLGTNKQQIVDAIHESVIVDTPLLEINVSDWHYQFDPDAAQGALLASKWNLPERVRLQRVLEQEEANSAGTVHPPATIVRSASGAKLILTGSFLTIPHEARVNGVPLITSMSATGTWLATLPFFEGTGALRVGENLVRITGESKSRILDSFYIIVAKDDAEYSRLIEERRLADLYTKSRAGQLPPGERIVISNLYLENGTLRLRKPSDPPSVRQNEKGEPLSLTILTSPLPESYQVIAGQIAEQWAQLGVKVVVEVPASREEFEERLLRRQYDILLFGQSLLENLDSYPYWHSSGVQKLTGDDKDLRRDAYNLSQYSSFQADALLETVRGTNDEAERTKALGDLREVLKRDVPAIFLYSPLYVTAQNQEILGVDFGTLSLHSDRLLSLHNWYVRQERIFPEGKGWKSFFGWLFGMGWSS